MVTHGTSSECPFCLALATNRPSPGSRIIVLDGYACGRRAEVLDLEVDEDAVLCRFDGDPPEEIYREDRRYTAFLDEKLFSVPVWAPPLSVEDANFVHEAMMRAFIWAIQDEDRLPLNAVLRSVVSAIWSRRLPLEFSDIWPMLSAHGWPVESKPIAADRYQFGLALLRGAVGRRAVRRKRMQPFSSGKYHPGTKA